MLNYLIISIVFFTQDVRRNKMSKSWIVLLLLLVLGILAFIVSDNQSNLHMESSAAAEIK